MGKSNADKQELVSLTGQSNSVQKVDEENINVHFSSRAFSLFPLSHTQGKEVGGKTAVKASHVNLYICRRGIMIQGYFDFFKSLSVLASFCSCVPHAVLEKPGLIE